MEIDTNQKLPILFCHYGNTHYLRYTMKCAQLTNPDTRIILLGDSKNQWLSKYVEHHHFSDYENSKLLKEFESVYRVVAGPKSPLRKEGDLKRDWINFVFRRWYIVHEFCKQKGIDSFWHFDSDNMILDELAKHLYKFQDYDCTEKCNGTCINGYVNNIKVIENYLLKILQIFKERNDYLDLLQKDFDTKNPTYAFTEMRAYQLYRDEEKIKSIRMTTVINGEYFDDCLAQQHGMELEEYTHGKTLKKVSVYNRQFYTKRVNTNKALRLISVDLSWLPFYFFEIVYKQLKIINHKSNSSKALSLTQLCPATKKKYRTIEFLKRAPQRILKKIGFE